MVKSREAQHAMTERVQAAFAKWPRFEAMPTSKRSSVRVQLKHNSVHIPIKPILNEFGEPAITQEVYVKALFACAFAGCEPIGRGEQTIIGKVVD